MTKLRSRRSATTTVPTRFSRDEVERLDRARSRVGLPSRSALIRDAVLDRVEEVERMQVIEVRDVTVDEATELINQYIRERPGIHWTGDLAMALGLELRIAFEAVDRLIQSGRAKEAVV